MGVLYVNVFVFKSNWIVVYDTLATCLLIKAVNEVWSEFCIRKQTKPANSMSWRIQLVARVFRPVDVSQETHGRIFGRTILECLFCS